MVGLSDFGLASIIAASGDQTASREALTPAYASPESFRGEEPTAAADLYSLTATLYALLAGRPPRFPADGRSPSPAMIMALHDQPVDDVPTAPTEAEFYSGTRAYRCVASVLGRQPRTSLFRR